MRRSEYLETRRGQRNLLRRRRQRRVYLNIDQQQPKSKKGITVAEKVAFQQEVSRQLTEAKRRAFQSPLIVEIDFHSQMDNPPAIHTLAKCYMDLLETPVRESGIKRRHLLFANDRLIKALIVRYNLHSVWPSPSVVVKADTYENFIADLELVQKIESDSFNNNGEHSTSLGIGDQLRLFAERDVGDSNAWNQLIECIADEKGFVEHFGQPAFESRLWMDRHYAQEEHLHLMGDHARRTVVWLLTPNNFAATMGNLREVSISAPLTLELMHIPLRTGDSKEFKRKAKSVALQFRQKYKRLFPLSTLLDLTILFVPPKRTQDKDLDNLARIVVPFVVNALEPPTVFGQGFDIDLIQDAKLKDVVRRIPKCSIPKYQVFELPRGDGDPKEGYVRLAFGPGMQIGSLWSAIDDFLSDWKTSGF